ncbi:MAG: amidohydrolase family protein [Thiotrichales bacterium]|nr:amidohydrolase family protein [Thiotrichales bacterium]
MTTLDAHQHFWALERGDYGWLTPALAPLYRDFGPRDLAPKLAASGIDGTILVQAAPSVAETEYLLVLADRNDFIEGVVGWVDFEAARSVEDIARLATHPKLVGVRPMIQDIGDDDWMLRHELAPAYRALIEHGLCFDALVMPRHLDNLDRLIARYPELPVVVDHCAKPCIRNGSDGDGGLTSWAPKLARVASHAHVMCKLSGLLTEAASGAGVKNLAPYVAHVLDVFGAGRVMWGSDWPVLEMASTYEAWTDVTRRLVGDLTPEERSAVWGGNAARFYLNEPPGTRTE